MHRYMRPIHDERIPDYHHGSHHRPPIEYSFTSGHRVGVPAAGKVQQWTPGNPGYQFIQARAIIVIETKDIGYVAILPIGMGQMSSVQLNVEPGDVVTKGQELSYFQFGGSDVVMVFQKSANVKIDQKEGKWYPFGSQVAVANPK